MNANQAATQLFDLSNRSAIVTGGCGWLGFEMAKGLAEMGARVAITSRELDRARQSASRLPKPCGQDHCGFSLDYASAASISAAFLSMLEWSPQLDILVNNGIELIGKDWTNITLDEFARHQVNNAGYFEASRQLRNHAVQRQTLASIINIGSMYGQVASYPEAYEGVGPASSVAYHALKGGTIHMTRHLAAYWARDGVRVNCLSPGAFPNPASAPADLIENLVQHVPMKRVGAPWELKGAVVFLASDASTYVTGHNLTIDGGWTAW